MKTPNSIHDEIVIQAEVLKRCGPDTLKLIEQHGGLFRRIIKDYRLRYNRPATADEILWISSEYLGYDITKTKGA